LQRLRQNPRIAPAGGRGLTRYARIVHRDPIVIVTPALADANNGNWQTARRWTQMLQSAYRVRLAAQWTGGDEVLMIALHARRSAASIAAWRAAHPRRPLLLTLTGTDLYRDIDSDAAAQQSLASADALIVLNERGVQRLPAALRSKCHVLLQSCPMRRALPKTPRHLRALMVGHLRDEKDPRCYFRAAQRLAGRTDILLDHVGAALDPALGAEAAALAAAQSNYRWLGAQPHTATRARIQAAHVLVHASRIEGGAHVVIEAMRSGTPVLASRIDGNLGLLGADYSGTFAVGDDAALATLLAGARDDADMLPVMQRQLALRAPLFSPEAERATLKHVVAEWMAR
jgi:putative glycosyltransferase (TIGR04348 family)